MEVPPGAQPSRRLDLEGSERRVPRRSRSPADTAPEAVGAGDAWATSADVAEANASTSSGAVAAAIGGDAASRSEASAHDGGAASGPESAEEPAACSSQAAACSSQAAACGSQAAAAASPRATASAGGGAAGAAAAESAQGDAARAGAGPPLGAARGDASGASPVAAAVPPGDAGSIGNRFIPPARTSILPTKEEHDRWVVKKVEVWEYEYSRLAIGPFEDGVICEIIDASYGVPGDLSLQTNVTDIVRSRYSPRDGLRLPGFNAIFGDPARWKPKKFAIEYRLTRPNAKSYDVSTARYTEGTVGTVFLWSVIAGKCFTNVVGAVLAGSGYAIGKLQVSVENMLSDTPHSVADSKPFQLAFGAWLRCNGIWPSVSYVPLPGGRAAEDIRQTPLLICNHMSYVDGPVLAAIFGAPKIVAMKGTLSAPLIGTFGEEIGVIEVDRGDKASRQATMQAISEHVDQWKPGGRPLLLFPEGTTSNGEHVLPFKKGAFAPGVAVRPIVLTYTGDWHPANTNFKTTSGGEIVSTGDAEWAQEFFGHLTHSLQVKVLPPYEPNAEERADPVLYAENVHRLMEEEYQQLLTEVKRAGEEAASSRLWPMRLLQSAWARAAGAAPEAAEAASPGGSGDAPSPSKSASGDDGDPGASPRRSSSRFRRRDTRTAPSLQTWAAQQRPPADA